MKSALKTPDIRFSCILRSSISVMRVTVFPSNVSMFSSSWKSLSFWVVNPKLVSSLISKILAGRTMFPPSRWFVFYGLKFL